MPFGFTVVMIFLTERNIYNELYDYLMSSLFISYKTRYLLYEKAVWHTQAEKMGRWEDVYNHPGAGGTRSSGPCCYGCQHMGKEYTQHPPDSYANQHLCHTHKHRDEILTGIEFRRQADDYYWSPCEYNFKV